MRVIKFGGILILSVAMLHRDPVASAHAGGFRSVGCHIHGAFKNLTSRHTESLLTWKRNDKFQFNW